MSELRAILKLLDIAQECETVELNFLRWVVKNGTAAEDLQAAFSDTRSAHPRLKGMVFIATALQQARRENHPLMTPLRVDVLEQFDEPEVLIAALVTAAEGGKTTLNLDSLYTMVFKGSLLVGDDEYGNAMSTEAYAKQLAEKLENAVISVENIGSVLSVLVFESVRSEKAVLDLKLNQVLFEN